MKFQIEYSVFVDADDDAEAEDKSQELYDKMVEAGFPIFPVANIKPRPDLVLTNKD